MESGPKQIDLIWEADEDIPPSLSFDSFFEALAVRLELVDVEASVLVTNDHEMKAYNYRYRDKDTTTDVLSFPSGLTAHPSGARHLGDIVISYDRAKSQAQEIGHSVEQELRFLALHGVLHLMGYDHETDQGEMIRLQAKLKKQLADFF